jgi:hypothetical protein
VCSLRTSPPLAALVIRATRRFSSAALAFLMPTANAAYFFSGGRSLRPPDPRDSQSRPVEAGMPAISQALPDETPAATAPMIAFCKVRASFALVRGEVLRGDSSARPWADQGGEGRRTLGDVLASRTRRLGRYCPFCMTGAPQLSSKIYQFSSFLSHGRDCVSAMRIGEGRWAVCC